MGDGVQILKDRRHRSCCSMAAPLAEAVHSAWNLDARASIAEVGDIFINAHTRCDQLQQKIDMIKCLKKKKKLKRRSMRADTSEAPTNIPVISVQTKPKNSNLIGSFQRPPRLPGCPERAEGLGAGAGSGATAGGRDVVTTVRFDSRKVASATRSLRPALHRRVDRDDASSILGVESAHPRARQTRTCTPSGAHAPLAGNDARCVVAESIKRAEQSQVSVAPDRRQDVGNGERKDRVDTVVGEVFNQRASTGPEGRGGVWRARHYEAATAASRVRQASRVAPRHCLPFVISVNVAPSHNLAVNLQKLLNSLKIRQPPKGIPPTLAHHLGLNVLSTGGAARSYARALTLLRSGDGLLPRYLRSLHTISSVEDVHNWKTSDFTAEKTKRELEEYAQLCRELERVDERLGERRDPALELRRRHLVAQLRARQGKVCEIVRKYESAGGGQHFC